MARHNTHIPCRVREDSTGEFYLEHKVDVIVKNHDDVDSVLADAEVSLLELKNQVSRRLHVLCEFTVRVYLDNGDFITTVVSIMDVHGADRSSSSNGSKKVTEDRTLKAIHRIVDALEDQSRHAVRRSHGMSARRSTQNDMPWYS